MSADTPDASRATSQTQIPSEKDTPNQVTERCRDEGVRFQIGSGVTRTAQSRPYEHHEGDPLYRPLKIFTLDPSVRRSEGAVTTLNVPYERLKRGPRGSVFDVRDNDGRYTYLPVDLDDPKILLNDGVEPSASRSSPEFRQQMVYAVASSVYAVFRTALGRHVSWGFDRAGGGATGRNRLILRPHAFEGQNAFYDKAAGEIAFGYFRAGPVTVGLNLPGGWVYTSLMHDVVVHEMTHALVDGLRSHFEHPTGPDVLALHEGLADIVAVFQRFTYRTVVETALRSQRGNVKTSALLTGVARQFGEALGRSQPLRKVVDLESTLFYDSSTECHDRGSVLATAIFDAFLTVYQRRTEQMVRLATSGSGILPPGDLSPHVVTFLAQEASKVAAQFLSMCIRAIDYCPPVDVTFGDYLRALITADFALVPDDRWNYREALITAFSQRRIYPHDVDSLSEDALLWRGPQPELTRRRIPSLSFARLRFSGDPSMPAGVTEMRRQACALGRFASHPERMRFFGLAASAGPDKLNLPTVQSIRTTRRIGPQGQVVFDLVAEITQSRLARTPHGLLEFLGGSTVIIGPEGRFRYIVTKNVASEYRFNQLEEFLKTLVGQRFWEREKGVLKPRGNPFALLHSQSGAEGG